MGVVLILPCDFCNANWSELVSVLKVLDYDGVGKPAEYMCCYQASLSALQEAHQANSRLELSNKIRQKKLSLADGLKRKKEKSYGSIYIETFNITD